MGLDVGATAVGGPGEPDTVPFHGPHQAGVTTPPQAAVSFGSFDVTADRRAELIDLLRAWTSAAVRITAGTAATLPTGDGSVPPSDSGEALALPTARLTVTVGFGASLFDAVDDRVGLAAARPAALDPLPTFTGDQLQPSSTGGDLTVQVCADDPQVAFHGLRQLALGARGVAVVRWSRAGFRSSAPGAGSLEPPGVQGRDRNPDPADTVSMSRFVWAGSEAPRWMRGARTRSCARSSSSGRLGRQVARPAGACRRRATK